MKRLKITEEFKTYSEEEAIEAIENLKAKQNTEGYLLTASGYKYKTKKAKGEIISEAWVVTATKVFADVWEDIE